MPSCLCRDSITKNRHTNQREKLPPSFLVRAFLSENRTDSTQKNNEVTGKRPVLNIVEIQTNRLFPGEITTTRNLPQSR